MPYASIIVPTMRFGGLDVLFSGLLNQTTFDFEVVLVDGVHEYRKDLIAKRLKDLPFTVKHVAPFDNRFPECRFSHASNTGLCYAEGEIVIWTTDYMRPQPGWVAGHSIFHRNNPTDDVALSCAYHLCLSPPLHTNFPIYRGAVHSDTKKYRDDCAAGRLGEFAWSVFAKPIESQIKNEFFAIDLDHTIHPGQDEKLLFPLGKIERIESYFYAKNDSVKLAPVLRLNGYDEDFDGSHGWNDCEMFDRLCMKERVEWYTDPKLVVYNVNPRSYFPLPIIPRGLPPTNLALWAEKAERPDWQDPNSARPFRPQAYKKPVNTWSLVEKRSQILGLEGRAA